MNNKDVRLSFLPDLDNMVKEVLGEVMDIRRAAYPVWPHYRAGLGSMNGLNGPDLPPNMPN